MADITHLFLRRHLRSGPTAWTRHSVGGRTRHEGIGLSFAFRARTAVISEVPVEDRELSLLVARPHRRPGRGQRAAAAVTWRVVEPGLTAQRLDFGIDTRTRPLAFHPARRAGHAAGGAGPAAGGDAAGGHGAGRRR